MVEAIVLVGTLLCIDVGEKTVCQNKNIPPSNGKYFSKTVTEWKKIPSETNYNSNEEVKLDQENICPGH